MITTSICLPKKLVKKWRLKKAKILSRQAIFVSQQIIGIKEKQKIARKYNRMAGAKKIVTIRITETDYESLHYIASLRRISVSFLIVLLMNMLEILPKNKILAVINYAIHILDAQNTEIRTLEFIRLAKARPP